MKHRSSFFRCRSNVLNLAAALALAALVAAPAAQAEAPSRDDVLRACLALHVHGVHLPDAPGGAEVVVALEDVGGRRAAEESAVRGRTMAAVGRLEWSLIALPSLRVAALGGRSVWLSARPAPRSREGRLTQNRRASSDQRSR